MKQVPNMISTKDLSYLEDMFNWHFTLSKKAIDYSELVSDKNIATFFEKVAEEHRTICEKIVNKLG